METPGIPANNGTTTHVPVEIIDEILHYLSAHGSSLRNCALVCKSWTPSCRRRIFCRVSFKVPLDFGRWCDSVSSAPNGPHLHTRELLIDGRFLGTRSPWTHAPFLRHFMLYSNLRHLAIEWDTCDWTFDTISVSDIFGHLFGTLRFLSIRYASCSPHALMSLVAPIQHLEHLELKSVSFDASEPLHPTPERRTFKGIFTFVDSYRSSERFFNLLAGHDLQYREMHVNGEGWLCDTVWNRCLVKCADNLEKFSMDWTRNIYLPQYFLGDCARMTLTFGNLRELSLVSSPVRTAIFPPPEFLSSITSRHLSEVTIKISAYLPDGKSDPTLDAIKSYDEALCQLANQLDPSPGSEKLTLTLQVWGASIAPDTVLPQFSEVGILKVVKAH